MIKRGRQLDGTASPGADEAGVISVESPMAETFSTCRTRSVLVQQRNPSAQSGISAQPKNENLKGLLKGVARFGAGFEITAAIAQGRTGQAKDLFDRSRAFGSRQNLT